MAILGMTLFMAGLLLTAYQVLINTVIAETDYIGEGIFGFLLITLGCVATYVVVLAVVQKLYGKIIVLTSLAALVPLMLLSEPYGENQLPVFMVAVLVIFLQSIMVYMLARAKSLSVTIRIVVILLLLCTFNIGLSSVISAYDFKQEKQDAWASVAPTTLIAESSEFPYRSFEVKEGSNNFVYFTINYTTLAVDIYPSTVVFDPPNNCQASPFTYPARCEIVATTPNNREVWKSTKAKESYSGVKSEYVTYYAVIDDFIIQFNENSRGITDKQAVDFIAAHKVISLDNLKEKDPTSTKNFEKRLSN